MVVDQKKKKNQRKLLKDGNVAQQYPEGTLLARAKSHADCTF